MSMLNSTGNSNSWGSVAAAQGVQQASNSALTSAVGAAGTTTSGGFFGIGATTSVVQGIDQFFTASSGGTDVAGMNVEAIEPQIIPAVEEYIAAIEARISELENADAERVTAFKGDEMQASVANFIQACREHLMAIASTLRKFNGRLREVGATYRANLASNAADIQAQAGTIAGSGVGYEGS